MFSALCVGAGGFVGATMRYLLGLLPYQGEFPLITFVINFVGSFLIGVIAAVASAKPGINQDLILFLKTGCCGGFTTFSTFSLEAVSLWQKGSYLTCAGYAGASLVVCMLGVVLGQMCAKALIAPQVS